MSVPRIAVNGRLTDDPTLKFGQDGKAVCRLRVAAADRRKNKATNEWEDGDTLFISVTVFGRPAENAAESVKRGDLVTVTGRLVTNEWTTEGGEKRSAITVIADSVAADLTFRVLKHGEAPEREQSHDDQAPAW